MSAVDPIALIHPGRLSQTFGSAIGYVTARRLQTCQRLRPALLKRLLETYEVGEPPLVAGPAAAGILTSDEGPLSLCLFAGAAWHGRALRSMVQRDLVAMLVDGIGGAAYSFGLRHALTADPPISSPEPSALAGAIEQDGLACLAAWCSGHPKAVTDWIRLRLPAEMELPSPSPSHLAHGPALIESAMAERATPARPGSAG